MRARARSRIFALFAAFGAVATGCIENHDGLAAKPESEGSGGTYGASPHGGASGVGGDASDAETTEPSGDGGASPGEPTGPRALTVVHGVIDSPVLAFCFARVSAGVEQAITGDPLPAGGLKYGRTAVFETLPNIDLASDGIRPYVVAGLDSKAIGSLDCAAAAKLANAVPLPPVPVDASVRPPDATIPLDASTGGPAPEAGSAKNRDASLDAQRDGASVPHDATVPVPPVRAAAMAVVPAGQLTSELHYLLVASGCLGGTGVRDPSEKSLCGEFYSATTPTLSPVLVSLSRATKANRVGLGCLDASPAFSHFDVRFTPPLHSDPLGVVQEVVTGALRPRPQSTKFAAEDIGAASAGATVQLYPGGSTAAAYDAPWQNTLDAGDLAALENGDAYTLIYIGPFPAFQARRWWNGPLVTIVKN